MCERSGGGVAGAAERGPGTLALTLAAVAQGILEPAKAGLYVAAQLVGALKAGCVYAYVLNGHKVSSGDAGSSVGRWKGGWREAVTPARRPPTPRWFVATLCLLWPLVEQP